MIDIDDFPLFMNNKSTLKETSRDNHDGNDFFMTESSLEVINFDGVKDEYIRNMQLIETPCSNDVLYIKDNQLIFIEFKNGQMRKDKQFKVRKKIFDSLLILTDIIDKGVSYTRSHMDYILVYNESKNPTTGETKVQESQSRTDIASQLQQLANKRFIRFDLERFQNLYFNNVYTYTEAEFHQNFVDLYSSNS